MSVKKPIVEGDRVWSDSIDHREDVYLVQGVESGFPFDGPLGIYPRYVDPWWTIESVVIRIRRPGRHRAVRRRMAGNDAHPSLAKMAGEP